MARRALYLSALTRNQGFRLASRIDACARVYSMQTDCYALKRNLYACQVRAEPQEFRDIFLCPCRRHIAVRAGHKKHAVGLPQKPSRLQEGDGGKGE